MNFLSHFYFDRHSSSPERVLGTVLPDLLRNANKDRVIHPEKRADLLTDENGLSNILTGWTRHVEVDRLFHCSGFFMEHSKAIRSLIVPFLENSPVRPSFLSHIALELMLDSLLVTERLISVDDFYMQLNKADRKTLAKFLELNDIHNTKPFFQFFDRFIDSAYLKNYSESQQIVYALNRICMRLWKDPLDEPQKLQLTSVLIGYTEGLRTTFMDIFDIINHDLKEH